MIYSGGSWPLTVAAGFVLGMCIGVSHNFFHQKTNFRQLAISNHIESSRIHDFLFQELQRSLGNNELQECPSHPRPKPPPVHQHIHGPRDHCLLPNRQLLLA